MPTTATAARVEVVITVILVVIAVVIVAKSRSMPHLCFYTDPEMRGLHLTKTERTYVSCGSIKPTPKQTLRSGGLLNNVGSEPLRQRNPEFCLCLKESLNALGKIYIPHKPNWMFLTHSAHGDSVVFVR